MIKFAPDDYVVEPANIQVCQFVKSINIANTPMQQVIAPEGVSGNNFYATNAVNTTKAGILKEGIVGDVVLSEGANCSISRNLKGFQIGAYANPDSSITHDYFLTDGPSDGNDYTNTQSSRYKCGGPKCSDILKSINGIKNSNVHLEAGEGIFFEVDDSKLTIKKAGTQNLGSCIPDPCSDKSVSNNQPTS